MRAYEEVRAAYMRVFDFDGTIYDGESLFDLYLFSAKYNPKVLRYIARYCAMPSNTSSDEPRSIKWNTVWASYATDI